MRTTLTLDPDVARRLELEMRRRDASLKETVNEALRRGLGLARGAKEPDKPYRVTAWDTGFRPGIDTTKLGQLADELETAASAAKLR